MSLRIVVCVKYVPDATGDRRFADDHTTDREGVDGLLSELDEYGVEQALRIAEANEGAEVTVLTVGPDDAKDALRKALSMGADRAVHVNDEDIHGSDVLGTSAVLAKALERTGFDLVIGGMASTDGTMGVLAGAAGGAVGCAAADAAVGGVGRGRRGEGPSGRGLGDGAGGGGAGQAVVSVTDQSGEARYPSFKGIMAAKKKPVESLDLDDLGIDAGEVGLAGSWTAVESVTARPARTAGTVVKDEGEGGKALAGFLADQKFI